MALLPFNWSYDNEHAKRGPGVDRPREGEKVRQFKLLITFGDAQPMRWTVMAPTAAKAKAYAKARWPHCTPKIAK